MVCISKQNSGKLENSFQYDSLKLKKSGLSLYVSLERLKSLLLLSIESKFSTSCQQLSSSVAKALCSFTVFEQREAVVQRCSVKKVFLKISQNSQENTCARVYFNFIKKETLAQVFSCEFCKSFKNIFF